MNYDVEIVDPLNYDGWNEMLSKHSPSSPFLTSNWAKVLHDTYGYRPVYFLSRQEGKMNCILPFMDICSSLTGHRGVSLPFSDYCDPQISHDGDAFALLYHVIEYGRKHGWKYCEFRGTSDFPPDVAPTSVFLGHSIDIGRDVSNLQTEFKTRTKRSIKKALAAGVKTEVLCSEKSVKTFYNLHCLTRRRHGLPPQPYSFFESIHKNILEKDLGVVVLATHNAQPIAGSLYLHFGEQALYKFSAADERYLPLCGSSLALWDAIRWYNSRGVKTLCLGRCAENNEGLRRFKLGWGTKEYEIPYYKYIIRKHAFAEERGSEKEPGIPTLSKMPVAFLKLIGAAAYRHMG